MIFYDADGYRVLERRDGASNLMRSKSALFEFL